MDFQSVEKHFYKINSELRRHSSSVAWLTLQIAKQMNINKEGTRILLNASYYHDIGKSVLPVEVLNKKGILTKTEKLLVKSHTVIGYGILRYAGEPYSLSALYVLYHHERWDGKGYPIGLKRTKIPLFSRIITIADVYDALVSDRPYKEGLPHDRVMRFIHYQRGKMFDPDIADIFIRTVNEQQTKKRLLQYYAERR